MPELSLSLPSCPDAPAIARGAMSCWCEELPIDESRREVLRLLVSELVTNAVVHAPAEGVRLAASLLDDGMHVAVSDSARRGPMPAVRAPAGSDGGYGLYLVEHEAERWGVERATGTRVWFVLGL